MIAGLAFKIKSRTSVEMTWIRAVGNPYEILSNSTSPQGQTTIVNHFRIDLRNQSFEDQKVTFHILSGKFQDQVKLVMPTPSILVKAGKSERVEVFIQFPKEILASGHVLLQAESRIESLLDSSQFEILPQEVRLIGPFE